MTSGTVPLSRGRYVGFSILILAVSAALRVAWISDMEYKFDQVYMVERVQNVGVTEEWPWLGMYSSVALRNPGMSVWVFLALGKLFQVSDPVELALSVVFLNVLAIGMLLAIVRKHIAAPEQEYWLWALGLAAVNPVWVAMSRVIWAQSVLPFFCAILIWGWLNRHRFRGGFALGAVGLAIGQIHMSGFFFFPALIAAARWFRGPVSWKGVISGAFLALLPALPWIQYMLDSERPASRPYHWHNLISPKFWVLWSYDGLGLDLSYTLGGERVARLLAYPLWGGRPTYGVFLIMGLISVLAVAALITYLRKRRQDVWRDQRARKRWFQSWIQPESETRRLLMVSLLFYGAFLSWACGFAIYRHFFVVTFPLTMMAWVLLVFGAFRPLQARRALSALIVLQSLLSVQFLHHIHQTGGDPDGPYGTSYRKKVSGYFLMPGASIELTPRSPENARGRPSSAR